MQQYNQYIIHVVIRRVVPGPVDIFFSLVDIVTMPIITVPAPHFLWGIRREEICFRSALCWYAYNTHLKHHIESAHHLSVTKMAL